MSLKQFITAILPLITIVGCAYSGGYRFENGKLLTPTTQQISRGLIVDIPIERSFENRCILQDFVAGDVVGEFKYGFPTSTRMLRLIFPNEVRASLEARGDLEGSLRDTAVEILKSAASAGCLHFRDAVEIDGLAHFVARQARARWPMTPEQAVSTWYGPGAVRFVDGDAGEPPKPDGQEIIARVTFLRPGMRVCAHDVSNPTSTATSQLYTVAGTTCATVIDGPRGMAFSGTTPWLDLPFSGSPWAPGGIKQVSTWEGVQTGDVPHQFAVVHPVRLAETPPNPVPSDGAFLVRFNPSTAIAMQADFCIKRGLASNECPARAAFQAVGQSFRTKILCSVDSGNICIRFGNRSIFTIEIPVVVNDARLLVPAGSTLAALLGQVAPDFLGPVNPSVQAPSYRDGPDRDRLQHVIGEIHLRRWFDGKRYRVRLGDDALALPLQPGDEIRW